MKESTSPHPAGGKSAVLVAISVGLGASPRFTSRATRLSDYIKKGKKYAPGLLIIMPDEHSHATIEITIHNGDALSGYNYAKYGMGFIFMKKF